MKAAILTDTTRCIGCGSCALACKEINGLPGKSFDKLDAYTWTVVESRKGIYVRRQCMHCLDPTCASVCPVGALHKTELGPVVYDPDKCFGCRYCVMACPFDVPKYQWDKQLPRTQKCIMCYEKRVSKGLQPACTQVCPAGATIFGERDDLLREARRRIQSNPGRYVDRIYGEHEAGGTSVLYLSSVPFEELGFPKETLDSPYPALTWAMISQIPKAFTLGGALLFGTAWVINRRMENARREADAQGEGEGEKE